MANQIELIKEFAPLLDDKFRYEACSSVLEGTLGQDFKATKNPKTVLIAKMTTSGMGDYSRVTGYPSGDINLTWEEHQFTNDRGRKFNIDSQDMGESLMDEFVDASKFIMEESVIPELDAYRFAKIASTEGIRGATGDLTTNNTKQAIDAALADLGEQEVDERSMFLFMTPTVKTNLESQINRSLESGVGRFNQKLYYYNDVPIITVPQTRFYTAIDLLDGTSSGEVDGGYKPHVSTGASGDADAKKINFILLNKRAVSAIVKHTVNKVITPEYNQEKDGYMIFFRYYHDLFVKTEKANGIYTHTRQS